MQKDYNFPIVSHEKTVIEEANWLTVHEDIAPLIGDGFDAVLCLGNSFAHMLDAFGDQREQKQAICNFEKCVKPGGILLIDHRNYDNIMDTGDTPSKSIYYNVSIPTIFVTFLPEIPISRSESELSFTE